jgi:hypothetical protein
LLYRLGVTISLVLGAILFQEGRIVGVEYILVVPVAGVDGGGVDETEEGPASGGRR